MSKLADIAGSEQLNLGDITAKFGGNLPPNGDCPNSQQCELERQQRPYYLPQRCHWRAWGDWERCPKLNGGAK